MYTGWVRFVISRDLRRCGVIVEIIETSAICGFRLSRRGFVAAAIASAIGCNRRAERPSWTPAEMIQFSAVDAVAALQRGDFTAEEYASALLAQCQRGDRLNAFITLVPDRVLEAARAADQKRRSGAKLGPLHGLPIPIKDSINAKDYPTTAGTPALRNFHPKEDAPIVGRLRDAGAIVLGKTNLHELSFGWTSNNHAFGPVHNPYDATRIPGGSSGGTGAAIAARMAPLGVAEDTEGSIRVPAAMCGIAGFRPTTRRYPTVGTAPISPLFDQVGPHARSVADLALFDAVAAGDASRSERAATQRSEARRGSRLLVHGSRPGSRTHHRRSSSQATRRRSRTRWRLRCLTWRA